MKATTGFLVLTPAIFGYLVVHLSQVGESVPVPLLVIPVLCLVLAAAIALTKRSWLSWLALALFVVAFVGDAPHQVEALAHPVSAERVIVAIVALVEQPIAIVASLGWCISTLGFLRRAKVHPLL